MAATSKLLRLRPVYCPSTAAPTSVRFFSSSSNTPDPNENSPQTNPASPPPPPPPQSQFSFSSYFSDVKARLKQQQQRNPQSQAPSASTSPSRIRDLQEIRKNLAEFRRRSAVPPPSPSSSPPQSPQHLSLQEIFQHNIISRGEESPSFGSKSARAQSLDAIRSSLSQLRATTAKNQNGRAGQMNDAMSLSKLKESLKLKPGDPSEGDSPMVIGGSDNLPLSIFGKEMRKKEGGSANAAMRTEFGKTYSLKVLGEKLRLLRPEKKGDKKDWFSLEELNERLMKLREIEEKESESRIGGVYKDLQDSLVLLKTAEDEKPKNAMQRLDILGQLGRTPSFMLSPPKEHLFEKYFHPDNMSASEKLKLELKKVRDEFKMSESDCGSARVQVAQLTTKIKHLSTVLQKKDKHSRKGLQGMVQKRKRLLKYLRRTDWESYSFVLSKLGLRDNPDYKN